MPYLHPFKSLPTVLSFSTRHSFFSHNSSVSQPNRYPFDFSLLFNKMVCSISCISNGVARMQLRSSIKKKMGQPASWKRDVQKFVWNAKTLEPRKKHHRNGGSTYGLATGTFVTDTFEYFADLWSLSARGRKLAFPFVVKAIHGAKANRLLHQRQNNRLA